jgi:putative SOS response-associated peptidase YedK
MCGRAYSTYTDQELAVRYFNKKAPKLPSFTPNFNLSPTQKQLVLRQDDGKLIPDLFRWGLIPAWAKDMKIGYKLINARGDTVAEKPSFRTAFKKRRCIVPLSGFIEWKRDGESKRPFKIHLKDEPILSMAGLWEEWHNPENEEVVHSFCVITTEANSFMEKIHDRMPVILSPESEEKWLDYYADPSDLQKLLKPCPSKWLAAEEISPLINSPKNNRPEVLNPL